MGYSNFEALEIQKKERILEVCLEEFAVFGYEEASTNRIVKKINMSKGSLFNYFNTKEELYFYVIDHAVKNVSHELTKNIPDLPEDIYERLIKLAELEFGIYINNPLLYSLFKEAFSGKTIISKKLLDKYGIEADSFFDNLIKDTNFISSKFPKEKIFNVLKWVLKGFNEYFMSTHYRDDLEATILKDEYINNVRLYIEILKNGINNK